MINIFPITTLTETEEDLVANALSNPVVKKYLHKLAYDLGADMISTSMSVDESAEEWIRKEIHVKGRLHTIDQLLSFQPIASKE